MAPSLTPTDECHQNMVVCGYCDGTAAYECKGEPAPTPAPVTSDNYVPPTAKPVSVVTWDTYAPTLGGEDAPTHSNDTPPPTLMPLPPEQPPPHPKKPYHISGAPTPVPTSSRTAA